MTRSGIEKVYGLRAALAAFATRPDEVTRIAHGAKVRGEVSDMLREAARLRIAYEERSEEDLERIAGSPHHEGICIGTLARPVLDGPGLEAAIAREGAALVLDGVTNPHNLGAIVRSMAWFGVRTLVLPESQGPALTPAAVRVAEGGAEAVQVGRVRVPELLRRLPKHGISVVAADARRYPFRERTVIVLGAERTGVSPASLEHTDVVLSIGGARRVESLNVSVAAGILLALATR